MRHLVAHCHLGLGNLYRRRASVSRPRSISPPPRRCTAKWDDVLAGEGGGGTEGCPERDESV